MKKELRDTIMAISGIIVSISAGVWTLFNYNINQEKSELDIIFTVSSELSSLRLNFSTDIESDDSKKYKEILGKLRSDLPYRYIQISKPFFLKKLEWDNSWEKLIESLNDAFEESTHEPHLDDITSNWNRVLEMKGISNLSTKGK